MKKIAELKIGNKIIAADMYQRYGSPTLYVCFKEDKVRSYYKRGYYQAYCVNCGASFTLNTCRRSFSKDYCICPVCGTVHRNNALMYADDYNATLPDVTVMKVIDFKDKVELRIKYSALCFGRFVHRTLNYQDEVSETYTFDIKNGSSYWQKSIDGKEKERMEIGYIGDFSRLKEKTALWFYNFYHKINNGNSFTELLKILRDTINKKMKACGKTPKPLYIGGTHRYRLYGNVLNLAHKVRFWDVENIPALAQNECEVKEWERHVLCKEYLPENFEKLIYKAMQQTGYIRALCQILKLPYIPHVRRNLQYENLAFLKECYKIKNYDVAQCLFSYPYRGVTAITEIQVMTEFYNSFSKYYPKMQMQYVVKKWSSEYRDILRLWQAADKITKAEFEKETPALSTLHDWLVIAVNKQKDREIIFDVPEEVVNRYTMLVKAFGLKCIERNSELKYWASSLHNCAAGYKNSIGSSIQLVGISDNRGKPVALLEINGKNIIQAMLFGNKPVRLQNDINATVIEFAAKCGLKIDTSDVMTAPLTDLKPQAIVA